MNKIFNKKIILITFIAILFIANFVSTIIVNADNHVDPRFLEEPKEEQILKPAKSIDGSGPSEFVPLQTIKDVIDKTTAKNPSLFFNAMFDFGIVIAGFLAVIMIAYGGIRYMSTDAIHGKSEGREIITAALMGLLLILFSYILLKTINPDILKFDLFNKT